MSSLKDVIIVSSFCGVLVLCVLVPIAIYAEKPKSATVYTVECGVMGPGGPVGTIKASDWKDVVITDFGIIKHSRGLYVPNINEICFVNEVKD